MPISYWQYPIYMQTFGDLAIIRCLCDFIACDIKRNIGRPKRNIRKNMFSQPDQCINPVSFQNKCSSGMNQRRFAKYQYSIKICMSMSRIKCVCSFPQTITSQRRGWERGTSKRTATAIIECSTNDNKINKTNKTNIYQQHNKNEKPWTRQFYWFWIYRCLAPLRRNDQKHFLFLCNIFAS